MIIQCSNGGNYTQSGSCDNIEDDTGRNVMIEDALKAVTNNFDMDISMQERKSSSESLRSEVTESARSADKVMIKQNIAKYPPTAYNPGDVDLIKADAVSKRGKLSISRTKAFLAVVREHRDFLYTVTLLTGTACRDLKVKVDKITSLTKAVETGKQSKAHIESSEQYKNVMKLHRVMVFQVSKIRIRNVTEECLIARTRTRQRQCGRGQLSIPCHFTTVGKSIWYCQFSSGY